MFKINDQGYVVPLKDGQPDFNRARTALVHKSTDRFVEVKGLTLLFYQNTGKQFAMEGEAVRARLYHSTREVQQKIREAAQAALAQEEAAAQARFQEKARVV